MEAQGFYDALGQDYDLMVSWEERLAREDAFFRRVFDENDVRSVLDAACGTGMHAIAFARTGRQCTGADLSPVMVERARQNAREAGVQSRFEVAGFGELASRIGGTFDAVTCLGNSLPHLLDDASLHACLSDFAGLLRAGGCLVIQNRNYDRLLRERQRFMPLASRADAEGETLFLRITSYPPAAEGAALEAPAIEAPAARSAGTSAVAGDEAIEFTIVVLKKRNGAWVQSVQSTPLRALRRATLESALARAGFSSVKTYGSYGFADFDAPGSGDLVAVAVI
jgi:SAM-dependent methyltransferase